jgi:hypothetical protein
VVPGWLDAGSCQKRRKEVRALSASSGIGSGRKSDGITAQTVEEG